MIENEQLTSLVRRFVSEAKFKRVEGREICYSLPLNAVTHFNKLFESLERDSSSIGIESYGISMTTLEAVYLKLSQLLEFFPLF